MLGPQKKYYTDCFSLCILRLKMSQRNSGCIVVAKTTPLFVALMPHIFEETPTPWSRCVLSILFRCQPSSSKSCFTSTVLSGSLTILEGISCDFIIFSCHDLVWILDTSCFSALKIHAIIVLRDHTPASRLALFQVPCESVQYCQSGAAVDFTHRSYQKGLCRMISQVSPMTKRCTLARQDHFHVSSDSATEATYWSSLLSAAIKK